MELAMRKEQREDTEMNDDYLRREYHKIPNIYNRETFGKNRLIEGDYANPYLEYLKDNEWVWTEKVDGTNIRIIWDGHRVDIAGRTNKAQIPVHLMERLGELFLGEDKEELFESLFGDTEAVLFGEGFGEKIQKGGKYGAVDFILFDVLASGFWLRRESVEEIATNLGIRVVPIVGRGDLNEAVEFIKAHPGSMLRDDELEGVVCRPNVEIFQRNGDRVIVKIKCRDFPKGD